MNALHFSLFISERPVLYTTSMYTGLFFSFLQTFTKLFFKCGLSSDLSLSTFCLCGRVQRHTSAISHFGKRITLYFKHDFTLVYV